MSSYALEARGLGKRFGNTVALCGLDLAVSKGEVICLLGANGAGKTTTINLFLGFLQADEGKALVHGIDAGKAPLDARRKLAYLPESVALYPKLSGIENLRFFDRLAGGTRSDSELGKLLETVGLAAEAHQRHADTYSKGMRQKVGIAIAMARQAKTLLLDEPMSGLDPSAASDTVPLDATPTRTADIESPSASLAPARRSFFTLPTQPGLPWPSTWNSAM